MNQLIIQMAKKHKFNPQEMENILRKTIMPANNENISNEQFLSFLSVAHEYDLNPLTKEIYAFPSKNGGIQPIVSVDGWLSIINNHSMLDGIEFTDTLDSNNKLISVTCKIYRKDRSHPIEVTEYMAECYRPTDPWKKWPSRMLRHKSLIQCARYAFGLSGIIDEDEAERYKEAGVINVTPQKEKITEQQAKDIEERAIALGKDVPKKILTACHVDKFEDIPKNQYPGMLNGVKIREQQLAKEQQHANNAL